MSIEIPEGAFYSTDPDSETLSCESPEEALAEWADSLYDPDAPYTRDENIRLYYRVTLYVWRREKMKERFAADVARDALDRACESYDEYYGPVDDPIEWPAEAETAARTAIEAALRTLFDSVEVWRCERVAEVTLDAEQVIAMLGPEGA